MQTKPIMEEVGTLVVVVVVGWWYNISQHHPLYIRPKPSNFLPLHSCTIVLQYDWNFDISFWCSHRYFFAVESSELWCDWSKCKLKVWIILWYYPIQRDVTYIGVWATCCLLSKPKVTMTSLCSTAAFDCHTSQGNGRYRKWERSILVVVVGIIVQRK